MKYLLTTEKDVEWLPLKNQVEFYRDTQAPKRDLIVAVFVYAFLGDQILFTKDPNRGWEPPGGHLEKNEDLENGLKREVYEETCAKLKNIQIIGYFRIILSESKPMILDYPFPESYILLYTGHVDSLDPFVAEYETKNRKLFPPEEAIELLWIKRYRAIYDLAFKEMIAARGK
jgi:8-oxo-dGTP diphosphatase